MTHPRLIWLPEDDMGASAEIIMSILEPDPEYAMLTTKLMLDYLGETEKADRLMNAIAKVIEEGRVRTYDIGGTSSTLDMTNAVANNL